MIYFLVTAPHRYTIDKLLAARPGQLPVEIVPVTYPELVGGAYGGPGTFIFTDLERLTPEEMEWLARMWNALERSGRPVRLMNHPLLAMRRYELLRELYERRINDFNVYHLTEGRRPQRYPVFVRAADDHRGGLTPLLHTPAELDAAVETLVAAGKCRDTRIVVEFCGGVDDRGYYRKYGAFFVNGTVIPRRLLFSTDWIVKGTKVELDDDLLAKEYEYLTTNPHEELIRRVFQIARIDFGRVDYGLIDGRVRIYEINTDPSMYGGSERRHEKHFPDLPHVADKLMASIAALDPPSAGTDGAALASA